MDEGDQKPEAPADIEDLQCGKYWGEEDDLSVCTIETWRNLVKFC